MVNCKYLVLALFFFPLAVLAQKKGEDIRPIEVQKNGKLSYTPDAQGNRIPDFSYAGYMAGDQDIPMAAIRVRVAPVSVDATAKIQQALDYVATLPLDKNGLRGAVLLDEGVYTVEGALRIKASGVVLRGSGVNKTTILGVGLDRQTLISIAGKNDREISSAVKITDAYVPVNAVKFSVEKNNYKVGDNILVQRPATAEWIQALGTDHFGGGISALGWKPGNYDIAWDRRVVAVEGNTITIDAPITTALDANYGGGVICTYTWNGRIANVGIENLTLKSSYDEKNKKDEAHRWMAVVVENAQDVWVRQVSFLHFAGSAVAIWETAKRVTVEDCKSLQPVSEIANQRRNTFYTMGQQTLFQRCYAEKGMHDLAVGFCAAGPNAFVQCESKLPYGYSGTIDSWASGVLVDVVNVDGNVLGFVNRNQDGQGAGWTGANSMLWQCSAAKVYNEAPPTAQNWAIGTWAQFIGEGYWGESNNQVQPRSLYYAQLSQRLGRDMSYRAQLIDVGTEASSSPTVEAAAELTALAKNPAQTLPDWIDKAAQRNPISLDVSAVKPMPAFAEKAESKTVYPIEVKNGWLVRNNALVTGQRISVPWWNGSIKPNFIRESKPAITRFVPGRTGTGYTDDLDELTDNMLAKNIVGVEQNYALWYDRRRDDHERIRRMDGEVWPPFYELPFARTGGDDLAWDGLSKYDLTKYNSWYFLRLKQFADLADKKNLLLVNQHYFQHNIIEAGAHWADSPWRSANNVNSTEFPEPPNYAGDKRIFMAEQFYDISNPTRRALHKAYIRQSLNNFADNGSVIHLISEEFTGPKHFVEFWLDVIAEWEKETGKKVLVGLSTTKDVQDAILADAKRAAVVDIIDIRYWWYQPDVTVYAPEGGKNLAPRQHMRVLKPKPASTFEQVYRAVSEYKKQFPDKAVVYSSQGNFEWAEFFAGGSLPAIPIKDKSFLAAVAGMKPTQVGNKIALKNDAGEYIVYATKGSVQLNLTGDKNRYAVQWVSAKDGSIFSKKQTVKGGAIIDFKTPQDDMNILWLKKL